MIRGQCSFSGLFVAVREFQEKGDLDIYTQILGVLLLGTLNNIKYA